jgi:hypothetical protein
MAIYFPTDTKEIIDEIRGTIGRDVTIYVTVTGIACTQPTCSLDPVTNLSTDSFCLVCGGNYWLDTTSGYTCSGHIRWLGADKPMWVSGGVVEDGDCKVTITMSAENLNNVKNSHHFVVDDIEMYMKEYRLKGVQPINRIQIILLEDPDV